MQWRFAVRQLLTAVGKHCARQPTETQESLIDFRAFRVNHYGAVGNAVAAAVVV